VKSASLCDAIGERSGAVAAAAAAAEARSLAASSALGNGSSNDASAKPCVIAHVRRSGNECVTRFLESQPCARIYTGQCVGLV